MRLSRRHVLLATAALSLGAAPNAAAHDFILRPSAFRLEEGAPLQLVLLIGHGQDRQRWQTDPRRILRFESVSDISAADHLTEISTLPTEADHPLALSGAGTHVLLFESAPARSDLPAERFEAYIAEEGLTPAQEARRRDNATATPGHEYYSRRAKALVQIGAHAQRDAAHVTLPYGQTLELVTAVNPYALAPGEPLPVRVFYEGQLLPGALVKLWDLNGDATPLATARTDENGQVIFQRPSAPEAQLGVIWTRPLASDSWAQFETTFASLTFGA